MKFILGNNKEIPKIGFGTWKLPNSESTIEILENAIKTGYRCIDTAYAYGNEEFVGKGIKKSKINRNELFIIGKLWNDDRGYDNIIKACKRTINNLNCDYLDLYLVHWPASPALYENWIEINNETWKAMEYLYNEGYVKAIGVSNFNKNQLENLIESAKIVPMVDQIEFHPGQMQKEILDFCKKNNIVVQAWSPFGSGKMFKIDILKDIASKYNKSIAELCIKWCLQNEVLPLPKSSNIEQMNENLNADNFEINQEDMELLNKLPYVGGSGLDSETITIFN